MSKKNTNEHNNVVIQVNTSTTIHHSKYGKATINFGDYVDLQLSFVDSKGREKLVLHFSPEIEGIQAQVSVLNNKGDSVSHLAAIFK
jgi:hypothetical protein